MPSIIVTLIGPDRPGLVECVSDVVERHGGNWLESRMAHLAGQFAGIVQVDAPANQVEDLTQALKALSGQGLQVIATVDSSSVSDPKESELWSINVVGNDRPGIIRKVCQVLSSHDVNVEELSSECTEAPLGGGQIFRADAVVRLPEGLSVELLQDELERIATDLMIDFHQDRSI
ncbi:MAG: ACT domain-containing protein [Planctomycetaceae bacterium]|nr:ACT domain-containing protein [Planctomycetaceae bacterium]